MRTSSMSEKQIRKTQDEIGAIPIENMGRLISRNAVKSAKRLARSRHGTFGLSCDTSYATTASFGAQAEILQGHRQRENPGEYSDEAQQRKMEKAAAKRARKSK